MRNAADLIKRKKMSDAQQGRIMDAAEELMVAGRLGDKKQIREARRALKTAVSNLQERGAIARAAIKTGRAVGEVARSIQTLRYGSDISFAFRQAGPLTMNAGNILNTLRAFKNAYHALGREEAGGKTIIPSSKGASYIRGELEKHAQYELGKKAGLELALYGHPEEVYSDNIAARLPWIKRTEAANEAFIDYMRLQEFGKFVKRIDKNTPEAQRNDAYKRAAEVVNTLTGRASLGEGKIRDLAQVANGIMGAPRLSLSRIKMADPTWLVREYYRNPEVGKQMARELFGNAVTWGGLLTAGAATGAFSVVWDPDDRDFGKIVVGKTRYDATGGLLPVLKLGWKALDLATGIGVEAVKGTRRAKEEREQAQEAAANQAKSYLRSRLGPLASYVADLVVYGQDYERRPVTLRSAVNPRDPNFAGYRLLAPLGAENVVEAAQKGGAGRVARTAPFEFVGIGAREPDQKRRQRQRPGPIKRLVRRAVQ